MRNMLAFVAALALTVVGAGWYLGWFTLHTAPSDNGQQSVTVDINTKKIGEDLKKGAEKVQQKLAEKAREAEKKKAEKAAAEPEKPTDTLPIVNFGDAPVPADVVPIEAG